MTNDALKCLEELANTKMDLPFENWCRISSTIRAALAKPVDVESIIAEIKNTVWLDSLDKHQIEVILRKHLATQGYIGVPEGYALVPIDKQFDGKTFRLVAAEYGCLQDIGLTVRDMSVLKAAPKKEGE